ncbi:ArsR/SmtB family transcription factor [Streptomyces sp. NPDC052042]|uniref:ArsR/SmtB family transcription factor n=1 Tax=Streptomyces sp. NPDC052042 TaxID=3365683 RepID=UPI0037D7B394
MTTTVRAHWAKSPSSPLTPIPDESSPAIEYELSALRSAGHGRFAHLMGEYWDAALARSWPAMRGVLEEEVLTRGRILVTRGTDAMLEALGGRICWERPELSVPHPADLDWRMRDGRLVIVPTLFARGARVFATWNGTAAFSYQAQGAAVLGGISAGGPQDPVGTLSPGDRLTILLGRGRATVLRALHSPATTTGLAGSVGLAPSTVSQHLSVLSSAGLVRRYRVGPWVLYELGDSGTTLLSVLDG